MKIKYYYQIALLLALPLLNSCDSDEQIDELIDTVERGAILRTVETLSNELPIGDETASFSVLLEEQDQENGALLQSVDVFVMFTDDSEDAGNSSNGIVGQEIALRTLSADEFTTGSNGLPRTTLTIPVQELLEAVNLTADNIFGGDFFTTRLVLNLIDGRSFTNTDANGNIASGSFFRSPFRYITPVVCPIGETEFIGEYVITNVVQADGDNLFSEGGIVLLEGGETSVERSFTAVVLGDLGLGQPATPFVFQLVCNEVIVADDQGTNLGCGGSLTLGPPIDGINGTYATGDDSTFEIIVGFNESGAATCAGSNDAIIRLSRQ